MKQIIKFKKGIETKEFGECNSLKLEPASDTITLCACGCGQIRPIRDKENRKRFYIKGHGKNTIETEREINIKEDQESYQILIGSLLGDAGLVKPGKNVIFREKHCIKQKDYLLWKRELLNKIVPTKLIYSKNQPMIYSGALKRLNKIYEMFYPNGKKIIREGILEELNFLGLAVWYMDDGSYNKQNKCINISTDCLNLKTISDWFNQKKLYNKIQYNSFQIVFNRDSTKKILEVISPHIHPSMKYKILFTEEEEKKQKEYERINSLKSRLKNPEKNRIYQREWARKRRKNAKECNQI